MTGDPLEVISEQLTEAIMKPMRDVGRLLAMSIDDLTDEVGRLRAQLNTLDAAYTAHLQTLHGIRKS